MPFGVVSGDGREMGVLDEGPRVAMEGKVWREGSPIGLNGVFECF